MRLMKAACAALLCIGASFTALARKPHPHVEDVNPLIGTSKEGQTSPNVGVPFGMTQWTPATRNGEVRTRAPYYYDDKEIVGFRGSHFMSGSGTKDYGSFQLFAGMGVPDLSKGYLAYPFSHVHEIATPYHYQIDLSEAGVTASMTATTRCGLMRFRFEKQGRAWISVQNMAKPGDGTLTVDTSTNRLTGENKVRRVYAGSGKLAGFSGYVVVEFDRPFHLGGRWSGGKLSMGSDSTPTASTDEGAFVLFDVKAGESVQARIGTSFVSVEEAERNLHAEVPDWNFQKTEDEARGAWNVALGKIDIEGTPDERRVFYTALYHASQVPRICNDVSGSYPRFSSPGKIEYTHGQDYYDDFSLWDTFRALHPLLTLIDPARESEMVQSLVLKGEQGGFLPMFPAWGSYTQEMLGDHAASVIGDAYIKGLRGFDIGLAYSLMRKNALESPHDPLVYQDGQGRRALQSYLRNGYIPLEDPVGDAFHQGGQVSRTLEYAYDDFVIGEVAQSLGKNGDAALFHQRASNYHNVIDPASGYARGRHQDGSWSAPFNPSKEYPYLVEGRSSQYTFFVPQDIKGLIAIEHGNKAFVDLLDAFFVGKEYDQGNEPSHQIAYLYDYASDASKTQMQVSEIRDKLYKDSVDGLPGNDDAGQMSAWLVFSALGFYPVTPGTTVYAIGSPKYSRAVLHLENGRSLVILRTGGEIPDPYIQSATLNGRPLHSFLLQHTAITKGGKLVFHMGGGPNFSWPTSDETEMQIEGARP